MAANRSTTGFLQRLFALPEVEIPEGEWLELPRRGRTWLVDLPGPEPDSPAVVLLHAVGCTGLLTWFPVLAELNERYRVVVFDQRWHGQGIKSERLLLSDCASDVAAVVDALELRDPVIAGFSMGSVVAQRVWRQHPDAVGGLVLAATTDHFRASLPERGFHAGMELGMGVMHAMAHSSVLRRSGRAAAHALDLEETAMGQWALEQWRSTSPWAVGQALATLGRFHSTPWLPYVDVPTAVVVTMKDHVIPPARQRRVAELVPGATMHEVPVGHAGCVLESARFVQPFVEAVNTTVARVRDRQDARR